MAHGVRAASRRPSSSSATRSRSRAPSSTATTSRSRCGWPSGGATSSSRSPPSRVYRSSFGRVPQPRRAPGARGRSARYVPDRARTPRRRGGVRRRSTSWRRTCNTTATSRPPTSPRTRGSCPKQPRRSARTRRRTAERWTWSPPPLPPEPAWVGDVIDLVAAGEMVSYAPAAARASCATSSARGSSAPPGPCGASLRLVRRSRDDPVVNGAPRGIPGSGRRTVPRARPGGGRDAWRLVRVGPAHLAQPGRPPAGRSPRGQPAAPLDVRRVPAHGGDQDLDGRGHDRGDRAEPQCHGFDAVFLVDNGSTDETVRAGVGRGRAGGDLRDRGLRWSACPAPRERGRRPRVAPAPGPITCGGSCSTATNSPRVPNGISAEPIPPDARSKVPIGRRHVLNHLPDGKPEYVESFHPIDFQAFCYRFVPQAPPCALGHWKHPLQRFDRRGHFVLSNDGAHTAFASERLSEPSLGIVVHHFQYRDEEHARGPSSSWCAARGPPRSTARVSGVCRLRAPPTRSLDAVYAHHWADLDVAPQPAASASTPSPGRRGPTCGGGTRARSRRGSPRRGPVERVGRSVPILSRSHLRAQDPSGPRPAGGRRGGRQRDAGRGRDHPQRGRLHRRGPQPGRRQPLVHPLVQAAPLAAGRVLARCRALHAFARSVGARHDRRSLAEPGRPSGGGRGRGALRRLERTATHSPTTTSSGSAAAPPLCCGPAAGPEAPLTGAGRSPTAISSCPSCRTTSATGSAMCT